MEHLVNIAVFPETTDHWEGSRPLRQRTDKCSRILEKFTLCFTGQQSEMYFLGKVEDCTPVVLSRETCPLVVV